MQQRNIAKPRLYEQIVQHVEHDILSGTLTPGERLPPERDLAAKFGVSRASIREALSALQSRGFIESRQGGATVVRMTPDASLGLPLSYQFPRIGVEIRNPLEVRGIFEPQTAALAAERATAAEIRSMRDLVYAQQEVVASGGLGIDEDTAFHITVAQASHNELILAIVRYITDALRETREWSMRAETGARQSIDFHCRILAAIEAHDAHGAQAAMAEHLKSVQNLALRWLTERAADLAPDGG